LRFLIDEMFPPASCADLRERGHDTVHVRDCGLDASSDRAVATAAAEQRRVLVTENVKDFAHVRDLVILCVLKARLRGGGLSRRLAELIDDWARGNPEPYVGLHWPAVRQPPAGHGSHRHG